jgi:DNA-binding beta-propeller fold protein YncE
MDGLKNNILYNITINDAPKIISINPSNDRIYVATEKFNNIAVIDDSTGKHIRLPDIALSAEPEIISINPISNQIYVVTGDKLGDLHNITIINGIDYNQRTINVVRQIKDLQVDPFFK